MTSPEERRCGTCREAAACSQCGMMCYPNEYHPYLACLAYMQCGDSSAVRANMDSVMGDARREALAEVRNRISEYNHKDLVKGGVEGLLSALDRLAGEEK